MLRHSSVRMIFRSSAGTLGPLLVAVALTGCSGPKIPPPSAFYSAVDLQAVVDRCASKGVKWGSTGRSSIQWGGIANIATMVGSASRISLNTTATRSADNEARMDRGAFFATERLRSLSRSE